jgi:uncharacterized protein YdeI (YjbR/CyaY-like superfamily)
MGSRFIEEPMQKTFQGVVEPVEMGISSVMVRIPFDPVEVWPVRSKLRVKGTMHLASEAAVNRAMTDKPPESISIATSLIRSQRYGYFLLITGKMRKGLHVSSGATVKVTLEPDLDDLAATPPPELAKFLKSDRSLKKWFSALNYSLRKYIADNITEPKSAEARERRAEQWAERMLLTMEGEEVIPPILQIAFRRQPLARAGWEAISVNRRRWYLLSIFSCQSPEARAKAVERAMDQAMHKAGRGRSDTSGFDDE